MKPRCLGAAVFLFSVFHISLVYGQGVNGSFGSALNGSHGGSAGVYGNITADPATIVVNFGGSTGHIEKPEVSDGGRGGDGKKGQHKHHPHQHHHHPYHHHHHHHHRHLKNNSSPGIGHTDGHGNASYGHHRDHARDFTKNTTDLGGFTGGLMRNTNFSLNSYGAGAETKTYGYLGYNDSLGGLDTNSTQREYVTSNTEPTFNRSSGIVNESIGISSPDYMRIENASSSSNENSSQTSNKEAVSTTSLSSPAPLGSTSKPGGVGSTNGFQQTPTNYAYNRYGLRSDDRDYRKRVSNESPKTAPVDTADGNGEGYCQCRDTRDKQPQPLSRGGGGIIFY